MRFSDIKGQQVVSVKDAHKLGIVTDLLLSANGRQILAVVMQRVGLMAGHRVIPWGEINAVGANAVTVQDESMLHERGDLPELGQALDLVKVLGVQALDAAGTQLGTVSDIDFDQQSGQVVHYFVQSGSFLHHHLQSVGVSAIQSISPSMVVINQQISAT